MTQKTKAGIRSRGLVFGIALLAMACAIQLLIHSLARSPQDQEAGDAGVTQRRRPRQQQQPIGERTTAAAGLFQTASASAGDGPSGPRSAPASGGTAQAEGLSREPTDPLEAVLARSKLVYGSEESLNRKGDRQRVRIYQTDTGLGLLRVEERVRQDPQTAKETRLARLAMVADRMLVMKQASASWTQVADVCETQGLSLVEKLPGGDAAVFQMTWNGEDRLAQKTKAARRHKDLIACAEPDYLRTVAVVPSDLTDNQWALHNPGTFGLFDADMDAPEAWDRRNDASAIKVAVVDTGVRYTHEDLVENIWTNPMEIPNNQLDDDGNGVVDDVHGANFMPPEAEGDPMDAKQGESAGHGTHLAGIIGARGNNQIGTTGIAWKVQLIPIRITTPSGLSSVSIVVKGLAYARAVGARIVNASYGGPGYSELEETELRRLGNEQILLVAAAGNEGRNNDQWQIYPGVSRCPRILSRWRRRTFRMDSRRSPTTAGTTWTWAPRGKPSTRRPRGTIGTLGR